MPTTPTPACQRRDRQRHLRPRSLRGVPLQGPTQKTIFIQANGSPGRDYRGKHKSCAPAAGGSRRCLRFGQRRLSPGDSSPASVPGTPRMRPSARPGGSSFSSEPSVRCLWAGDAMILDFRATRSADQPLGPLGSTSGP